MIKLHDAPDCNSSATEIQLDTFGELDVFRRSIQRSVRAVRAELTVRELRSKINFSTDQEDEMSIFDSGECDPQETIKYLKNNPEIDF